MNMKRWVSILIGITLIAFGIGTFSLIYNDNFRTSNIFRNGIIHVKSNGDNVTIGESGIVVKDGDINVKIGWDGIDVRDGDEHVTIGWGGITVKDGGKTKFNLGNPNRWGIFNSNKLKYSIQDEEKFLSIEDMDSIVISSQFVDIKIFAEDRSDILVKYYGEMKSDVVPKLNVNNIGKEVLIKLDNPNSNYAVKESDVVLEIFVPIDYKKDISATTSSADIYMEDLIGDNISLYTTSGDIKTYEIEGNRIKLASTSGDIELEQSIGRLNISATSGDVKIYATEDQGDININATSGNVSIKLEEESNYKIKAKSISGDVKSNFYIPLELEVNSRLDFEMGDGKYRMDITTTSGDIKINK